MEGEVKRSNAIETNTVKPVKIVEGFSLVVEQKMMQPDNVSPDGIINATCHYDGGVTTRIIDYYRLSDDKICVETTNTVYVLKSIDPAFVKSGVEILRKLKDSRIKNIEKDKVKESDFIIKDTLQLWGLNRVHGSPLDSGVIGRVVTYGSGGQTTPIDSFWKCDTGAVIVKTVSGSYYKLGSPNLGFMLKHTDLMEELGLTSLDSK